MKGFFIGIFGVHILYSAHNAKNYCGQTSNLIARFRTHIVLGKKDWEYFVPWEIVHVEVFATRCAAIHMKNSLEPGKGRDWLKGKIL